MTEHSDAQPGSDDAAESQAVGVVRRWSLLMLLPFVGLLMFAAGGALALRAFAHNNDLGCGEGVTVTVSGGACSHYSYTLPIVLGVLGILVLMGGGALLSYFTARRIGVPAYLALRRRVQQVPPGSTNAS